METIMRALIVIHIPTREFPANSATSHSMIVTDSAKLCSVSWKVALATGGGELRLRPWLRRRQATATSSISGSPMIDCDEIGGACNSSPPTDADGRRPKLSKCAGRRGWSRSKWCYSFQFRDGTFQASSLLFPSLG